jgi:hypothetical protein
MNLQHFCFVVDQVSYRIQKQNTIMRESNIPDERMAVTLQFLATGETCKAGFPLRPYRNVAKTFLNFKIS